MQIIELLLPLVIAVFIIWVILNHIHKPRNWVDDALKSKLDPESLEGREVLRARQALSEAISKVIRGESKYVFGLEIPEDLRQSEDAILEYYLKENS